MAHRRSVHRVGSERRSTSWLEVALTRTTFTAVGGTILNVLSATELAKRPFTIVRTHLECRIKTDVSTPAIRESQIGAIGGVIISDQAAGIGVTAVPTPVIDAASDLWWFHQWLMSELFFGNATGIDANAGTQYSIDSKAMRKINDDQDVALVAEFASASDGFVLTVGGRILIKEH